MCIRHSNVITLDRLRRFFVQRERVVLCIGLMADFSRNILLVVGVCWSDISPTQPVPDDASPEGGMNNWRFRPISRFRPIFEKGKRYGHSYNGRRIGTRM